MQIRSDGSFFRISSTEYCTSQLHEITSELSTVPGNEWFLFQEPRRNEVPNDLPLSIVLA